MCFNSKPRASKPRKICMIPNQVRLCLRYKPVMEIKTKRHEIDPDTNSFIEAIKNTIQLEPNNYKSIDYLFDFALELQEKQRKDGYEHWIEKPAEFLLKEIVVSQGLSPEVTLHCINKYITLYSKAQCQTVIESLVAEYNLRQHLCTLSQDLCDVDLDLFKINNFVGEVSSVKQPNQKFVNALKFETLLVLNAIKHNSSPTKADVLLNELITCLELEEDLKLWYALMKQEHLEIVLSLCAKYSKLLVVLLRCFDKFADEIESNYDEELNVKYSHVNLDFEDFVQVFQVFMNSKELGKSMSEFLNQRMDIENKNFNFWLDVKACL